MREFSKRLLSVCGSLMMLSFLTAALPAYAEEEAPAAATEAAAPADTAAEDDNTFIVDGIGYRYLESGDDVAVSRIDETLTEAKIPGTVKGKKVTRVDEGAFSQCAELKKVTLPDTITEIAAGAFYYCIALEEVNLPDSVTDDYLDNAELPKTAKINDYWIVGVHGGVSVGHGYFNPPRHVSMPFRYPVYGFSITRFATMMNTFPNLGMEFGFQHNYEGYKFKEYEVDGVTYNPTEIDGATEVYMEVPELFLLTHGHIDFGRYVKANIKGGIYGGYRMNINRIGPNVESGYANAFYETDRRWTYGLQGGLGLGLMLDPLEFHLGVQVK